MVTSEGNRVQSPAMAPFERQAAAFQPVAETAESTARQSQSEPRGASVLRDPVWFTSLVVSGATIGSLWGLSPRSWPFSACRAWRRSIFCRWPASFLGSGISHAAARSMSPGPACSDSPNMERRGSGSCFSAAPAVVSIAGLAAVVLSILNFAMLGDPRFAAIAVILLGAGLLWHSGPMRCVSHFTQDITYHARDRRPPSGPFTVNALSSRRPATSSSAWAPRFWESWR